MLVSFMGVLTAIMSTMPQEALRLVRELPRDTVHDRLDASREGWEKFLARMQEPAMSERLDHLGTIVQSLERFGRGFELRLLLALVVPSYLAGGVTVWLVLQLLR